MGVPLAEIYAAWADWIQLEGGEAYEVTTAITDAAAVALEGQDDEHTFMDRVVEAFLGSLNYVRCTRAVCMRASSGVTSASASAFST